MHIAREIIRKFYYNNRSAGAAVSALGPVVAPVLRSMTSKLVFTEELGMRIRIFVVLNFTRRKTRKINIQL